MLVKCSQCGKATEIAREIDAPSSLCSHCHGPLAAASDSTINASASGQVDATADYIGPGWDSLALGAKENAGTTVLPKIPSYSVERVVGRGGMGVVLKARHLLLGRTVALKIPLHAELLDAAQRERFLREARSAARLRHPNICPIHEVGEVDGRPYIALAFIEGQTLSAWIRTKTPSARAAAELVALIARAVDYAHQHGVIHRDLKPANVLIDAETNAPVLMDFGLAKEISEKESELTHSGQIMGTPAYMAPEQAAGQIDRVGPRSDVYSLGAILYESLCGRPPFSGSVGEVLHRVQTEEPVAPRKLNPRLHRDLDTICRKALSKDPDSRYASAAALAEDLDRFCAGEAILARPERIALRLWRIARRQPLVTTSLALLAIAVTVAASLYFRGAHERRIAEMSRQLQNELDASDWSSSDRDRLYSLIDSLAALSANEGQTLRERLVEQYAAHLARALAAPRLLPEDAAQVRIGLEWLAPRAPESADRLQLALNERATEWEPMFDGPNRDRWESGFKPGAIATRQDRIHAVRSDTAEQPMVMTLLQTPQQAELRAEFSQSFRGLDQIGLLLDWTGSNGYLFRVRVADTSGPNAGPPNPAATTTFAKALESTSGRYSFVIEMFRNGVRLREETIPASMLRGDRLRLLARRDDQTLTFQVNDATPMTFRELFSIRAGQPGVFGLIWPQSVELARLSAWRKSTPVRSTPLERGDRFFAEGKLAEALEEYRVQGLTAGATEFGQEARCKQGLCFEAMHRPKDAEPLFLRLAAETNGVRWPMVAAFRLWKLQLLDSRLDEAAATFDAISNRFNWAELASTIPQQDRDEVIGVYMSGGGVDNYRTDLRRIQRLQQGLKVVDFFQSKEGNGYVMRWLLLRSLRAAGDEKQALPIARELCGMRNYLGPGVMEELCWLLRLDGKAAEALELIDRWVFQSPGVVKSEGFSPYLLIERARIHVALGDHGAAEKDLDLFFAATTDKTAFDPNQPAALLLRGLLRQRADDPETALQCWKQGYAKSWLCMSASPNSQTISGAFGGLNAASSVILGALTNELNDEQAARFVAGMTRGADSESPLTLITNVVTIPTAAMREAFRSPRGRQFVWQFAFRQLPFIEMVRQPPVLIVLEYIRQGAFAGMMTSDQENLVWQLTGDCLVAFFDQKLAKSQCLQLGLTWKGTTNVLGWAGVATTLDPSKRGPFAYVFGHRYRRLNNPKQAAEFFRIALKDAPKDSLLAKLAEAELRILTAPARK